MLLIKITDDYNIGTSLQPPVNYDVSTAKNLLLLALSQE